MSTNDPYSPDFNYKTYSLEKLEEWVHDSLNSEDITPQEIYDIIVNAVDENVECHKKYLTKNIEFLSLLKGNREIDLECGPYDGWDYDYDAAGAKFPPVTEATKKDWENFWEEAEEYTKEQIREFEAKERDYETLRARLDAQVSRNDPDRITFENGWVYESPDGGKTVTKRRPGDTKKYPVMNQCPPGTIYINGECADL